MMRMLTNAAIKRLFLEISLCLASIVVLSQLAVRLLPDWAPLCLLVLSLLTAGGILASCIRYFLQQERTLEEAQAQINALLSGDCTARISCDEDGDTGLFLFQICNHNLLLADAIHRSSGRRPILPDTSALVIDEAHKLPDAARQMFGVTLGVEDIRALSRSLRAERFLLAAELWHDAAAPLVRKLSKPTEENQSFNSYAGLLAAPERKLKVIHRQLKDLLTRGTRRQVENLTKTVFLFRRDHNGMVLYVMDDGQGGTMLCATVSDLTTQLRQTLWRQLRPVILTSGTMAVGEDFRRFKEETGLLTDSRVTESASLSPFDYKKNCLLYLPRHPPHQKAADYYHQLSGEIATLLRAAQGHALVLFTSYAAMSAVKERLKGQTSYPLFTMGRNAVHTMEQFKGQPGSVLLATGAAWEGFDFPGDCVSLLIIPRLPFAVPDALKEKEREKYPGLKSFIRAVAVPEMQIKLKQGFGRAIRTETDTCVIAILFCCMSRLSG